MAKTTYMRSATGEVFETSHPEYHKECENLGGGDKGYAARQTYVRALLRKSIKVRSKVYTKLNSVSSSGMSRDISVYIVEKGEIRNITGLVSDVCGIAMGKIGLRVFGCGMDMGFHVVYQLGHALWPKGVKKGRNGAPDKDGGYALKQEWL